jgi:hypothetical protein
VINKVINVLKQQYVTISGTFGCYFGARYTVDLALENVTEAIAIAHPSLLKVLADFGALKKKSNNPVCAKNTRRWNALPRR